MKSVKDIFGMKQDSFTKFVNPDKQSPEQVEDYATKKVVQTQEINTNSQNILSRGELKFYCSDNTGFSSIRGGASTNRYMYFYVNNGVFAGIIDSLGIWGFGSSAVASAMVAITSTTRGFLPPRMTETQKNAISSPAEGLIVYDTTQKKPYFYDGTQWISLA